MPVFLPQSSQRHRDLTLEYTKAAAGKNPQLFANSKKVVASASDSKKSEVNSFTPKCETINLGFF